MKKKPIAPPSVTSAPLYRRIRQILESARTRLARTVNTTQVIANWLIGREIFEEEQQGQKRAGYGEHLLQELSARLQSENGKGYSVDNLELFRRFFSEYPNLISKTAPWKSGGQQISEAVRRKLKSNIRIDPPHR